MARNWKELDGKNWRFDVGTPLKKALASKDATRMHVTSDNQIVMNGEVIGTGMYASFASGDAVYSLTKDNNGSEIANALRLTMPDGSEVAKTDEIKEVLEYCHRRGLYLYDRSTNARAYVDCGSTGGSFYGIWEVRSSLVTRDGVVSYMPKLYTITLKYDDTNKRFSVVDSLNGLDLTELSEVDNPTLDATEVQSYWLKDDGTLDPQKILNASPFYVVKNKNSVRPNLAVGILYAIVDSLVAHTFTLRIRTYAELTEDGVLNFNAHDHNLGSPKEYMCVAGIGYHLDKDEVEDDDLVIPNLQFGRWYCPLDKQFASADDKISSIKTAVTAATEKNDEQDKKLSNLQTTAGNAIASVASNMLSFGDGYGLAFKFTRQNGNGFNSPIIPVVGKISGEPGLMRNSDKKKLDTYPADYNTVELLIGSKVAQEDGKGLSSNDYSTEEKQTLANLEKYGYKAVIPSWTKLTKLTAGSTSDEIVTAMALRGVDGKTISDAATVNTILNDCAVRGKYMQENLTRAKVQVEFVGSYFVLSTISSQQYKKDDGTYSYRPILRTISLTYGANKGLAVRDVARDFSLHEVDGLAAIKAAVPNKIECFTLNPSHLPTEESGANFSAYLGEYTEMARIAAAGGVVRVDAGMGTSGHTYLYLDSLTVKYASETSYRLTIVYNGKEYFFANDNGKLNNSITKITTTSERIAALEARVTALDGK